MYFNSNPKPEPRKKKPKQNLRRQAIKKKYPKATGEGKLFLEVWNSRPHYCENCNDFLGHEAKTFYFAHIVGKGRNNSLRLVAANIALNCRDCHYARDNQGAAAFNKRKDLFKKQA